MKENKKMWISWHFQSRTRDLARALNVDLAEYFENQSLLKRHLFSSIWTIKLLLKRRPRIVFIQYSFLLLVILSIYKLIMMGKVVIIVDTHTKALRRNISGIFNWIFGTIKRLSFKSVYLTIIPNVGLVKDLIKFHTNWLVFPGVIPELSYIKKINLTKKYCVYISSFAVDEPFEEMLEVSKLLADDDLNLFWTGKATAIVDKFRENFPNVIFTGFLSFTDYNDLIGNAECLISLTYEEDCLQSGAREAIAVGVPIVTSDTKTLREYLGDSAVFTKTNSEEIYNSIKYAIFNKEDFVKKINLLKAVKKNDTAAQISHLRSLIDKL